MYGRRPGVARVEDEGNPGSVEARAVSGQGIREVFSQLPVDLREIHPSLFEHIAIGVRGGDLLQGGLVVNSRHCGKTDLRILICGRDFSQFVAVLVGQFRYRLQADFRITVFPFWS